MTEEELEDTLHEEITADDAEFDDEGGTTETQEDRARKLGWKPQSEFAGKGEWIDAEAFLKKVDEEHPALKKALSAVERKLDKQTKTMEALEAHYKRQTEAESKRAYDRAKAEYDAKLKEALESGDTEEAQRVIDARDSLVKPKAAPDPDLQRWKKENSWFDEDPVMQDAAIKFETMLANREPHLTVSERLEKTSEYIKKRFPSDFTTRKGAPSMPATSNGTRKPPPAPGSYEALKQDAKADCDRFVSDAMARGKDPEKAKAEWLKYAQPQMFRS